MAATLFTHTLDTRGGGGGTPTTHIHKPKNISVPSTLMMMRQQPTNWWATTTAAVKHTPLSHSEWGPPAMGICCCA